MPRPPAKESRHWVRIHAKSVRPESTTRQLSRADRCTFYEYVALARWQKPYRGCLSDADGEPWTRAQRAAFIGESYTATKRTEDRLLAAGLIGFQWRGVEHKDAVGRLRIVKYDEYQPDGELSESASEIGGQQPPQTEASEQAQPPKTEATASEIGGQEPNQPPKSEARVDELSASEIGGQEAERVCVNGLPSKTPEEKSASEIGGQNSLVVNDVNDIEERLEVRTAHTGTELEQNLMDRCLSTLGDLGRQGGARMTLENIIASHSLAREVILAECIALAARNEEGQNVHLSFLPRNVEEACRRLKREQEREATKDELEPPPKPDPDADKTWKEIRERTEAEMQRMPEGDAE